MDIRHALQPGVVAAMESSLEGLGRATARLRQRNIRVQWFADWNDELDEALEQLPELGGYRHDLYRELVLPTSAPKRHALVTERDRPLATISLRRRGRGWEPTTYQCLPGAIAPAADEDGLRRALHRLGVDVRIEAGLGPETALLEPTDFYPYGVHQVDLRSDYAAYWREKGRKKSLRTANKRCAHMEVGIDADETLSWTLEQWRLQWSGHPSMEVNAAPDRLRFWSALAAEPAGTLPWEIHTVQLAEGDRPTAGVVLLTQGGVVSFQCVARDPDFEREMVGTRIVEVTIDWARDQGYDVFDLGGGGGYKRWWGPVSAQRYGAIFRPWPHRFVGASVRLGTELKSRSMSLVRGDSSDDG